ncbi:hypothetical protein WJX73_007173 [Symbiochloris irregularis]|uniref:Mitochondrial carrier n=1 Tax=Symbiochloris irregularis TaxID=706552 RepID=A0AAW1PK97_9CHLO
MASVSENNQSVSHGSSGVAPAQDRAVKNSEGLELWQRVLAASGAGVVSAVIVNPLDLVKTRMQAALMPRQSTQPASFGAFSTKGLTPWFERGEPAAYMHTPAPAKAPCRSSVKKLTKIARGEGVSALWQGTNIGLLLAVPLVAIYLPLYDIFSKKMEPMHLGLMTPLAAGAGARTVAAMCTSPLELLKTRMQAASQHAESSPLKAALQQLGNESRGAGWSSGVRSIWRGVGATLAKDIPFASLYWVLLEPTRTVIVPAAFSAASTLSQRFNETFEGAAETVAEETAEHPPKAKAALAPEPAAGPMVDAPPPRDEHGHDAQQTDASGASTGTHAVQYVLNTAHAHEDTTGTTPRVPAPRMVSSAERATHGLGPEPQPSPASIAAVNALSGALAAGLGGFLTTPLDVVKTQAQTASSGASVSTRSTLSSMWKQGGTRALFTGAAPRVVRTSIAYAVLMSSYELCKAAYASE